MILKLLADPLQTIKFNTAMIDKAPSPFSLITQDRFIARRSLLNQALLVAGGAAVAGFPAADALAQPKEGAQYRTLKPAAPVDSAGKIELVEFFWYGCPHCRDLEPVLKEWLKKLPADVSFKKMHVNFQEIKHQQLFFTLQAMGKADALSDKVFYGIHIEKNRDQWESRLFVAQKIANDLFHYMQSFDTSQQPGHLVVPHTIFERWMARFESRFRRDPNFFMKTQE